jgi:hypothetical protein
MILSSSAVPTDAFFVPKVLAVSAEPIFVVSDKSPRRASSGTGPISPAIPERAET